METTIAALIAQFENGSLTRRQLIQSLAMLALAGPAAAQSSPAAAPPAAATAPWKTMRLDHISYAVTDYKRSVAFYRDLMGWDVRNDNGTNQATLNINGIGEIIIRNARRPAANPQPSLGAEARSAKAAQPGRPPLTGVINHISWGVQPWNTEAVEAELKRRGLNPRPDMQGDDFKSFHVLDPDGWDLQISNQTK
jgi:catechol 2,3-dioxygenase-like lactoylglutathione lyase family enzyme